MGTVSPEFCLASFIGVTWAFSLYICWHVARSVESRSWEHSYRRQRTQLFAAPWYSGLERESDFAYINGKCAALTSDEAQTDIGSTPQLPSPVRYWRKPISAMARQFLERLKISSPSQA